MSPHFNSLLTVFGRTRGARCPFVLIFGVLYPLKRRLDADEVAPRVSRCLQRASACPPAICLVVVAASASSAMRWVTNQFVDLVLFRDAVVLAYMFLLRVRRRRSSLLYFPGVVRAQTDSPRQAGHADYCETRADFEAFALAHAARHVDGIHHDSLALCDWHRDLRGSLRLVVRDELD